jgi:hypothetical protein
MTKPSHMFAGSHSAHVPHRFRPEPPQTLVPYGQNNALFVPLGEDHALNPVKQSVHDALLEGGGYQFRTYYQEPHRFPREAKKPGFYPGILVCYCLEVVLY